MSNYFRKVPDFEYVSRLPDSRIGDYSKVKNLFKRGKIREDIFQNVSFFERYQVVGDERPDNVAYKIYGDSNLDWVVLLSNNIINVQSEWPLSQRSFDEYLLKKYNDYETIYKVHHYETTEVKNSQGVVVIPAGLIVGETYRVSFFDFFTEQQIDIENISIPVTNYEYEERLDNEKRNIFILKPRYLNVILDDMEELMTYKKGSSQYVTETLKKADDIRVYQ